MSPNKQFDIGKVRYVLILAFSFLVPFSDFLSVRLLILILLISIIFDYKSLFLNVKDQLNVVLYFSVLLLGLIYTSNRNTGFQLIETNSSLLLVPLAFPASRVLTKQKWETVIQLFIIGLILACLACLVSACIAYYNSGDLNNFFYYNFTALIGAHPTYIAYYVIFAISWLLYVLFFTPEQVNNILLHSVILFLFIVLLLTGGQSSFISLLLVFSFFMLKFALEFKSWNKVFVIVHILFMLVLMFSVSSNLADREMNDSWDRFSLWSAAIQANSNSLIGEGTGDYQDVLNTYYQTHQMSEFAVANMNAHNQFIQMYFSNGIIGLISIMILLMKPIYKSFKMGSPLGILVFFPFLLYGITEVFLGRYQGVIFFALMHQVFFSYLSIQQVK